MPVLVFLWSVRENGPYPRTRVLVVGTVNDSGVVIDDLAGALCGCSTTADAGMPLSRRPTRVNRAPSSPRRPIAGDEVSSGTNGSLVALSLDATAEDDFRGRPVDANLVFTTAPPSLRRPITGDEMSSGANGSLATLSLDATDEDDFRGRPVTAD